MTGAIFFGIAKKLVATVISAAVFTSPLVPVVIADDTPVPKLKKELTTLSVIITAYSSTPEETDDTPFTTASGKEIQDGFVANNCLPFGTKLIIPELFGDKVFVVEDKKNSRYDCEWLDIWHPTKDEARRFGISYGIEALVLD